MKRIFLLLLLFPVFAQAQLISIIDSSGYLTFLNPLTNTKTYWTSLSTIGTSAGGSGDMLLSGIQTVTGLKTFDKDKLAMKGTSTGVTTLSTANTSGTSYTATLPAATGTLAYTSDITAAAVGLGNVNNTSDANKPVSTAQQSALDLKGNITSQTFVTPNIGVATATSLNKVTITQPATGATLTIPDGVTLNAGAGGTLGSNAFTSTSYLTTADPTYTGVLKKGTLGYTATNPLATLQSNTAGYNQFVIQNTNAGTTSSSDIVVNNDVSTETTFYGNLGINSSGYTGSGAFNQPSNVYLTATSGNLAIGTTTAHGINFVVNSGTTDAMTISSGGIVSMGTPLAAGSGGTGNANGTANIAGGTAGAIPYQSGANATSVLAATATAGQMLRSGASAAPTWSTTTFPNTTTTGDLLMSTGTNTVGSLAAVATGSVLLSQGTGTAPVYQNTRENWTTFVVSGSDVTTTGQSLVDITGLVSGTLTNSTLYEVQGWLYVTTSAVTTGTQYGIFGGGTGGAAVVSALITGTTTTNAVTSATLSAPATAAGTFLTTSGTSGVIYIHGFVTTRGTGTATISLQHLKVTSGTSTVKIGSKMQIRLAN